MHYYLTWTSSVWYRPCMERGCELARSLLTNFYLVPQLKSNHEEKRQVLTLNPMLHLNMYFGVKSNHIPCAFEGQKI